MPRFTTPSAQCLALVALALLLVGAGIGWRQPMNVDEERFLGVALEMLQSGNWFIPHRAAEIYGDKPPLFMWTVALFSALTGLPKVALYLPGLLSAATTTAVLYDLGRRLWNTRIGCIAALLFLATYQSYSILRTGQIDSFLALWVALGFYGLLRHLLLGPAWGWFYAGCAAMGLGIISKGVGFVPALMLLPYAWAVHRRWRGVVAMPGQGWRWSLGLLWLLAGCAVWLLPLLLTIAHGGGAAELAYLKEILLRQTANRYANAWDHREPFWYFFAKVIPKYWLPLVLALPWLVPAWRRQLLKHDGRLLVLLGWVALVLLFFSLSSGKRKLYIFPALPGLVLAIAPLLPWLLKRWFQRRPGWRKVFTLVAVVWFCLWFVRGLVEPIKEGRNPHETLMVDAARATGGAELVLVNWREGHWLFARQPIVHFGFGSHSSADTAVYWLRQHPAAFALLPATELGRCFSADKARKLGDTSRAEWYVVGADADTGQCQPATPKQVYQFAWGGMPGNLQTAQESPRK
ncbi:glycosyltransferase family 39 protein [Pseudomonas sichuanensis]|uniref:ArnT family glycosyltransferase n=1 Tax=Pseudomonas sichuanensis TaxID=2213015 RepID=UPI00215E75B0|nr:glycosyltransferase family 39 protein [Pseudomonas sichuanensis]UVK80927.1 glycosyltransferase family 39 protein [Pseudomonas sichuanensis]